MMAREEIAGVELSTVLDALVMVAAAHARALEAPRPYGGRWHRTPHVDADGDRCEGCAHEEAQARALAVLELAVAGSH